MSVDLPRVLHGDSREVLREIADNTFDSCVCDPPYALVSITKRFGADNAAPTRANDAYMRCASGFMGQRWDTGETAFDPEFWTEVLRVIKPGAHLLAFGGTRSYHRLACAIEDAGFEVRDMVLWHYGSGFPKSHNLEGEWDGWGTALKPASEPICLARKPLSEKTIAANVLKWGTGALNIDACRIPTKGEVIEPVYGGRKGPAVGGISVNSAAYVSNVSPLGRWPANVCHDGSDEVLAQFPNSKGQQGDVTGHEPSECHSGVYSGPRARKPFAKRAPDGITNFQMQPGMAIGDGGSAARFFYAVKADSEDRMGSRHPTVKPVDLMQWLVRLVTRKGGNVLDPFAGTGMTGEAAWREGMNCTLIEREERFIVDINRRLSLLSGSARERRTAIVTAKEAVAKPGPLFDEVTV